MATCALSLLRSFVIFATVSQMDWEEGFEHYVIHRLPQLKCLDGKDITKVIIEVHQKKS